MIQGLNRLRPTRRLLLAVSLGFVALNLRGAMTALSPVLPEIMRDTHLGAAGAGLVTAVPLLCLGVLAPLASPLLRRFGPDRALLIMMLMLAAGCLLRLPGTEWPLLASGVLVGGAIGMANVVLPSRVKSDFPDRAALMIGLYTMVLASSAAIGQAVSVPLAHLAGDWTRGLAWWALPAMIAAGLMGAQAMAAPPSPLTDQGAGTAFAGLWRHPMAWQITLFMGLQSAFTFIVFSWLPPLLRDRGVDPVMAGLVTSLSTFAQMAGSLSAPLIAARLRDQRAGGLVVFGLGLAGFLGCRYLPLGFVWSSAIVMGLGQGSMFGVALILLVLRSPTPAVTAQLSGMAQGVGYLMAATGPMLVGLAHDWMGNWGMVTPLMTGISVAGTLCCGLAGRARVIKRAAVAV